MRSMAVRSRFPALLAALALAASTRIAAQVSSPPRDTMPGPKVGEMAPDFSLAGATRYGLLKDPVRLADYRGSTVVLAFIVKARTKG